MQGPFPQPDTRTPNKSITVTLSNASIQVILALCLLLQVGRGYVDSYAETEVYHTFESSLFIYTFLCCISVEVFLRVVFLVSGFAPRLWCNLQQTQAYKPCLKQEHILSWGSGIEGLRCVNVTMAVWILWPVLLLLGRDTPLDLREVGKQKGNIS